MTHAWTDYSSGMEQYPPMVGTSGGHSSKGFSTRMRALRLAFGPELGREKQNAFAAFLGIGTTAWNNYERLGTRPDIDAARSIVAKFGVTLDWIYEGDPKGLRLELVERLRPFLEDDHRQAG